MNYTISEERLDEIIKPFLDGFFDKTQLMSQDYENDGDEWFGFYFGDGKLLIGHPYNDEDGTWFYNGEIISHGKHIFGVEWNGWNNAIKRYMNKKYPDLYVRNIQ